MLINKVAVIYYKEMHQFPYLAIIANYQYVMNKI